MQPITSAVLRQTFGPLKFAFAYGSGAFPQAGYDYAQQRPLIDLMIVPESTEQFHSRNLEANPQHYSKAARILGCRAVCHVQRWTTGVYFNTKVPLSDGTVHRRMMGVDLQIRSGGSGDAAKGAGRVGRAVSRRETAQAGADHHR